MTVDPFRVDPDGVRNLARAHSDVAAALDDAMGLSVHEIGGFEQRYGQIAAPAERAVSEILAARIDVLTELSSTSADLSDRLSGAVHAYERSDESAAASLRSTGLDDLSASGSSGTTIDSAVPESLTAASSTAVNDALTGAQPTEVEQTRGVGAGVDGDPPADDRRHTARTSPREN